ncbi:MAG: hypothetical protein WBL44_06045 [Nitrososphaeraceae archaeon]
MNRAKALSVQRIRPLYQQYVTTVILIGLGLVSFLTICACDMSEALEKSTEAAEKAMIPISTYLSTSSLLKVVI